MQKKKCFITIEQKEKTSIVSLCPSIKAGKETVKRLNRQYAVDKQKTKFKLRIHRFDEKKELYKQLVIERFAGNLKSRVELIGFCKYFYINMMQFLMHEKIEKQNQQQGE